MLLEDRKGDGGETPINLSSDIDKRGVVSFGMHSMNSWIKLTVTIKGIANTYIAMRIV